MMTTTAETKKARAGAINWSKLGAALAQFASWLTTFWCVEWIMEPRTDQYPLVITIAVGAEILLILMKRCLFDADRTNDGVGWAGLFIDTIINAGGILPRAGKFLTFPPIATMLLLLGIDTDHPTVNIVGAFVAALVAGALLSILPHRLWRDD